MSHERNESSRYELLVKIAAGGMGAVYVARAIGALGFENLVAVKRPHAHLLERPTFRTDLIEEARLASRIRHANVVSVRDVAVEDSLVYLVMDYVEGGSLGALMTELAHAGEALLSVSAATRIALDVCAGLQAAHDARDEKGRLLDIVHRDISPQNVLVGAEGVSRLTDFGIAKSLSTASDHTAEGVLKGRIRFMAPEYLRGERADRRADVFALSAVLWEMYTGERAFKGVGDLEIARAVLEHEPAVPSKVRRALPRSFDQVVMQGLAKDVTKRTPSAEALGEALERAAMEAGVFPSHREVGALVKKHLGNEIERIASAIRRAHGAADTIDLSSARASPPIVFSGGTDDSSGAGDAVPSTKNQPVEWRPAAPASTTKPSAGVDPEAIPLAKTLLIAGDRGSSVGRSTAPLAPATPSTPVTPPGVQVRTLPLGAQAMLPAVATPARPAEPRARSSWTVLVVSVVVATFGIASAIAIRGARDRAPSAASAAIASPAPVVLSAPAIASEPVTSTPPPVTTPTVVANVPATISAPTTVKRALPVHEAPRPSTAATPAPPASSPAPASSKLVAPPTPY